MDRYWKRTTIPWFWVQEIPQVWIVYYFLTYNLRGKNLQIDVSKILSSNEIYFQKFVEIIPISFQPVVVLEILLQCWSFVSHRVGVF
jgi:hypothetical protein